MATMILFDFWVFVEYLVEGVALRLEIMPVAEVMLCFHQLFIVSLPG